MLEGYLFQLELRHQYIRIVFVSLLITVILGIANYFAGGNCLFLVIFVSLFLSYPVVRYIRSMNREELEKQLYQKNIFYRHQKELVVFWAIFFGTLLGLIISIPFINDFTYQEAFVKHISGNVTNTTYSFIQILINNLEVTLLTFFISLIVFPGLMFILVWNGSIITYYLYSINSIDESIMVALRILPHGLLEIGGYVLAGIAGSIIAYRIDRSNKFDHKLDRQFIKDVSYLIATSLIFIILGALLESL